MKMVVFIYVICFKISAFVLLYDHTAVGTNFPKICEPPQNLWYQRCDMEQFYTEEPQILCPHSTKFGCQFALDFCLNISLVV
jgi:hypothetical protein